MLTEHGLDPDRVAGLVAGEGELGQLVSGELDVDRMDYLVRDAHHTGVPYGTIDHERLVRELRSSTANSSSPRGTSRRPSRCFSPGR